MGINDFTTIRRQFIPNTPISKIKYYTTNKVPVNIYIDGSFYLFSGYISSNIGPDGNYDEYLVAKSAFDTIMNQIRIIQNEHILIDKIYFYFDGNRPFIKKYTSNKRRDQRTLKMNVNEVMNNLTSMLNKIPNIIMCHLVDGESEHEAFIRRDISKPSIIFTDDSDLVHIAYNYEEETFNDYVFICTKRLNFVYDIHELKNIIKMPKYAFTLLMMLKGSDFTNSIFSSTMATKIITLFSHQKHACEKTRKLINTINEYGLYYKNKENIVSKKNRLQASKIYNLTSHKDPSSTINFIYQKDIIYHTIKMFVQMLILNPKGVSWKKNSHCKSTIKDTNNELDALYWATNYSLIGCNMAFYNDNIFNYTENLSIYSFLNHLFIMELDLIEIYSEIENSEVELTCNGNEINKHLSYDEFKSNFEEYLNF